MRDGNGISRFRKTRLFAVVFVNREYNGQPDPCGHAQILKLIKT